ncbi:hypothetical protein MMC17_009114 [Xylographa soralifera]|nr:hypothetical protein [Xylographa soralifera]
MIGHDLRVADAHSVTLIYIDILYLYSPVPIRMNSHDNMDYGRGEDHDGSNKRRRVEPRDILGVPSSALASLGSNSNTVWSGESDWSHFPVADALAIPSFDHERQLTEPPLVWEASMGTQSRENTRLQAHSGGPECPPQFDHQRSVMPWEQNLKDISPSSIAFVRSDAFSRSNAIARHFSKVDRHSENRSESNGEYQICFGMICSGSVKLDLKTNTTQSPLKVSIKPFGEMTARALVSLSSDFMVHLDAFVQVGQRAGYAKSGNRISEPFDVHVIIYGDRQASDGVGKSLMEHCIFLQHPQGQDSTVPYDNPHYLKRPGSKIDISCVSGMKEHEGHQLLTTGTIASIYVSSQGPPTWREVNSSIRLKTELMAHQKKALAMMVERERGTIEFDNDFATLWTVVSGVDNKRRYKNIVTGHTQEVRPNLCLGGLLADDMGLGKTLTVLALVARSLDDERTETHMPQSTNRTSHDQGSKSTLIITPKSTLQSWDEQIRKHIRSGSLKVHVYHGVRNMSDPSKLSEFDIVITTYGTLLTDWSNTTKVSSKRTKVLHSCNWHRVVLDEAHFIRDSMAKQSRAVHSLTAIHRWCLTGTPIQNRIEDLGALLIFLRVEPFDTRSTFKNYIANPINANKKRSMERLQLLVGAIALRRTQASIKTELLLPSRFKFYRGSQIHGLGKGPVYEQPESNSRGGRPGIQ